MRCGGSRGPSNRTSEGDRGNVAVSTARIRGTHTLPAPALADRRLELLSDQERIVLNDIERELGANDPELAQHLSAETSTADNRLWRYWLAGSILGLLMLISIAADLPVLMLILTLAGAGTATVGYLRRRKRTSE